MTQVKEDIFDLVDEFLYGLFENKFDCQDQWINYNYTAVRFMEKKKLFNYKKDSVLAKDLCYLTKEGMKVIVAGGIRNYLVNIAR